MVGDVVPGMEELHTAARALLETLDAAGIKLVTAESCTGGFLASLLTDIEGLSHGFDRGFVTYSKSAKQQMLGIDRALIEHSGAVSGPVVRAMAQGSLDRSRGGLALAITGFAGASDPDESESPGVTYVAAAIPHQSWVYREDFGKRPREDVRNLAAAAALAAGMQAMAWKQAL
ncbi:CinA family protein [Erythrobacter donghaensis]|jgi:nicotinamide-nucleotide amidase|uniref:CinA family protein n=1 Tax=Erythrobacter donghaensis TaxID=267135 RepID=UPI00093F5501|nr:nicotinamide-nucleotide amidohydrolase family protein [Erythrobacter donghaensis]